MEDPKAEATTQQQPPSEDEEVGFELGDRIYVAGGRLDGLRGRIYYIDESLIRILPDGVSDRLVDIPIVDEDIDPELGVEHLYILSKRTKPAFVSQIDAHVGQRAETFSETGAPGPTFTIRAVNESADTLVLQDETGAELELSFDFQGIPRDESFAVLRPRQPREEGVPTTPAEEELAATNAANEEAAAAEAAAEEEGFEDVLDEELRAEGLTEAAAGLDVAEIREIPASQRYYPDIVQRNDMLQDLVAALPASAQKNPLNQAAIRALVEQCIMMRNTIVQYSRSGEPTGQRATSYLTIADMLKAPSIPLSRPVIGAARVLNVDHTPEDIAQMANGNPSTDPKTIPGTDVLVNYLEDAVNQLNTYMETQLGGTQGVVLSPDSLPNWYLSWNTIYSQFMRTWAPTSTDDLVSFQTDREVLRGPIGDLTTAQVAGFPKLGADNEALITSERVQTVPYGVHRALGPRSTRIRLKEDQRRIEASEEAPISTTLLFPLSEQATLGSNRSGVLAKDMAHSHTPVQTLSSILERLDGIPDAPTAGGIVSVGQDGNTLGNIPLEDWLQALAIYPKGLADARVELENYGLSQSEFNVDQQEVLVEKIQTYRALVKQFITELRDAATKSLSQLEFTDNPFLTEEAATDMLAVLQAEPILATRMEALRSQLPAYKTNDLALFAGLLATSSDLVVTTLAQVPGPLARERNRKVRDQFLEVLHQAMLRSQKTELSGEPPERNDCAHVPSYIAIQKVKDDAQRLQLFARYLAKFQIGREDNWVQCGVCSKHLCCYHEVLLLQEYLHPREKDALHKELLLTFSGGQFHGRYMCKNCGQPIQALEFDTNLEFTDDGVPMAGRAVLSDKDAEQQDELDELLGPSVGQEEELQFKTDTQTLIYQAGRKLFDLLGIRGTEAGYTRIVQRVESELQRQPSREEYQRMMKGKRATDYDVILNRVLVASLGANVLVEIQTHIPGYVLRYRLPGCRAGFGGYPLGNEKDRTGVEYVACAIASIRENIVPWNMTGFQRETNDTKRRELVLTVMTKLLTSLLGHTGVQQQLAEKRSYLQNLYGAIALTDQLQESLPPGFMPRPLPASDVAAADEAVVPQAATPTERIRGWILQAHRLGKENGTYVPGSSSSEATCCLTRIQKPGQFWNEAADKLVELPLKQPPRGPIRSHLGVHIKPRPLARLEAAVAADTMYRIFLKVCYTGPRMGLPHEPGYTNLCPHCGFVFPESPYAPTPFPPMSSDSKTQKELMKIYQEEVDAIVTKGKVALETQRISITQATFEEVLDASHRAFRVEPPPKRTVPSGMQLLESLRQMDPEPFQGWRTLLAATMEGLSKTSATPDEIELAEAYGPISNAAVELLEDFQSRLGTENAAALKALFESSPAQVVESIRTYILVPFQRLSCGFQWKQLKVQKSYKLSSKTEEDINALLTNHLDFLNLLTKRATGFTLHKLRWARDRLAQVLGLLKSSLRASYLPGGVIGLPYVVTTLVGGILSEFINPNMTPPGAGQDAAAVDTGARAPIQILDICVQKYRQEGLNFTEEQIRDMINRRIETEKNVFINRFERLTPEEKAVEKMKKKLGLGEWAVSGTKAIYAYDPEQYERERLQRLEMGFQDFLPAGAIQLPEGDEATGYGGDGGYDNEQTREDDA